jgi:hypothetical protein
MHADERGYNWRFTELLNQHIRLIKFSVKQTNSASPLRLEVWGYTNKVRLRGLQFFKPAKAGFVRIAATLVVRRINYMV